MKKNIIRNLALGLSLSLPSLALAQGTYLADPNNPANHAVVVTPGGNVGFNTADAPYKVTIQSGNGIMFRDSAAIYANNTDMRLFTDWNKNFLFADSGGNELVRITGDGKVGIGTTAPRAKLDLAGDLRAESLHVAVAPRINDGILARDAEGRFIVLSPSFGPGAYNYIVQPGDQGMVFTRQTMDSQGAFVIAPWSSTLSGLRMTAQGDVGIGIANPQAKLDVGGDIRSTGIRLTAAGSWITSADRIHLQTESGNPIHLNPNGGDILVGQNATANFQVSGKVTCTVLELTSDRAQKSGFAPVDCGAVLEKVVRLPITTWHYTNETAEITHMGTMAQDFHSAFHLGSTNTTIASVDADGVLFASVQALSQKNQKLEAELQTKDARIAALEAKLAQQERTLATCLAAVEKLVAQGASATKTELASSTSGNVSGLVSQNLNQENQ